MSVLTAYYDLEHGPISYDFCTWLVRAMKEKRERRCERMHVVIVPNEKGVGGFSRDWGGYDEHAARWRLWHICIASCPLAAATVTVAPSREYTDLTEVVPAWAPQGKAHFMGPLVDAARKGEEIPKLRATEAAKRYVAAWAPDKYVTLTLRHQASDPARNSDFPAWYKLRGLAEDAGYSVVMLQDTNDALSEGRGVCELDPDLRLALYERAAMNFCGNNGPQELLKFSSAPYRIVGLGIESWREHFRKYFHMEYGDQLPWAGKDQRLVYEPDNFEVLQREFISWAES